MISLKRAVGSKKVYAIIGVKKYWIVKWINLEDWLEPMGYPTLREAQMSVEEVAENHLNNYANGGMIGDPTIMEILFGGETK